MREHSFLPRIVTALTIGAFCAAASTTYGCDASPRISEQSCRLYIEARNARSDRCGTATFPDAEGRGATWCSFAYSSPGVEVEAIDFVGCANELRLLACDQGEADAPGCKKLTSARGSLPVGEPCAMSRQCATGYCEGADESPPHWQGARVGCGTCATRKRQGEACLGSRCEEGLICLETSKGKDTCIPWTKAFEGDACFAKKFYVTKQPSVAVCASGLTCADDSGDRNSEVGHCVREAFLGDPCTDDCAWPELFCDDDHRCKHTKELPPIPPYGGYHPTEQVGTGEVCDYNHSCKSYLECNAQGTCQPIDPRTCQ